jgi:hypothetical protein
VKRRRDLSNGLQKLQKGEEPRVDPKRLAYVEDPLPEERAVLLLAIALNDAGPRHAAISWKLQEQACAYFNEHGLAKTLDEIVRLAGPEALS